MKQWETRLPLGYFWRGVGWWRTGGCLLQRQSSRSVSRRPRWARFHRTPVPSLQHMTSLWHMYHVYPLRDVTHPSLPLVFRASLGWVCVWVVTSSSSSLVLLVCCRLIAVHQFSTDPRRRNTFRREWRRSWSDKNLTHSLSLSRSRVNRLAMTTRHVARCEKSDW